MPETLEKYLKRIYYSSSHPAAYSGEEKLYRAVLREGKFQPPRKDIREWLLRQDTYTLNRPPPKRSKHVKVVVSGIDGQWDADLGVMASYKKSNQNYCYFLLCIDIFSRFIWTRKLKSKKPAEVAEAFESIWSGHRVPLNLRTDKGQEFCGKVIQKKFDDHKVKHFVTQSHVKAGYAEICLKTIKTKIFRYFSHKQTWVWINILPKLTQAYNASIHSSLGIPPSMVSAENEAELVKKQYPYKPVDSKVRVLPPTGKKKQRLRNVTSAKYNFKVGDKVRIDAERHAFARAYDEGWTREIMTVASRKLKNSLPVYYLKDFEGEEITGQFQENELRKVVENDNPEYLIDKVLKTRKVNGKTENLVTFLGWAPKFKRWLPASQVRDLKKS